MPFSVEALKKTVTASGVSGLRVTSTYRAGSMTKSGNVSWHARGQAIDVAGSKAAMKSYAEYMQKAYGGKLLELIHQSDGVKYGVRLGSPHTFSQSLYSDHKDHVHVAATTAALGGGTSPTLTPVEFNVPGPGDIIDGATEGIQNALNAIKAVVDGLRGLSEIATWMTKTENMKRVGIAVVGVGLVGVGAMALARESETVQDTIKMANAVKKVIV